MHEDTDHVSRRRVLATAGAAAVAGLGATGTAAASHLAPGQPVEVRVAVQSWTDACPKTEYGPVFEAGTRATVWDTCTSDGQEMALIVSTGLTTEMGWVPAGYLQEA